MNWFLDCKSFIRVEGLMRGYQLFKNRSARGIYTVLLLEFEDGRLILLLAWLWLRRGLLRGRLLHGDRRGCWTVVSSLSCSRERGDSESTAFHIDICMSYCSIPWLFRGWRGSVCLKWLQGLVFCKTGSSVLFFLHRLVQFYVHRDMRFLQESQ